MNAWNFKGLFVLGRGGNSKISKINKLQIKIPSIVSARALGATSYILDGSGGFLRCWGQSPPTTFYPYRLQYPSLDELLHLTSSAWLLYNALSHPHYRWHETVAHSP